MRKDEGEAKKGGEEGGRGRTSVQTECFPIGPRGREAWWHGGVGRGLLADGGREGGRACRVGLGQ